MKANTKADYKRRLITVVDYIYANLASELDVNELANVACMSPYHFHRIYRQFAQEPVNATIRRLRLQQAAAELVRTELPIAKIASLVGYASVEAFSRAFSKEFELSPSHYRQQVIEQQGELVAGALLTEPNLEEIGMYSVQIDEMKSVDVIGVDHLGDYMNIGQAFEKLNLFAAQHNLLNEQSRSFGVYYHDPQSVPVEQLKSVACLSTDVDVSNETNAPRKLSLPEGKYATLLFKGAYAELEKPYNWLFGEWLPKSGLEAGDFPPFEEYLNDPRSTPPNELLTKIHCLLKD